MLIYLQCGPPAGRLCKWSLSIKGPPEVFFVYSVNHSIDRSIYSIDLYELSLMRAPEGRWLY